MINLQNIKSTLGYVVEKRSGYKSDLSRFSKPLVDSFENVGFIHSGQTLKGRTYSITKLGDAYYRDLFGICDHLLKRTKGFISKIFWQKTF